MRNIGIYFIPDLMLPFSNIETIIEENNAISMIAVFENVIKCCSFIVTSPMPPKIPGAAPDVVVCARSPVTLLSTNSKLNDNANNIGAMNITIADMNIMYANTDAFISSFNSFVFLRLCTMLSRMSETFPPDVISLAIRSIDLRNIDELYFMANSSNALSISWPVMTFFAAMLISLDKMPNLGLIDVHRAFSNDIPPFKFELTEE